MPNEKKGQKEPALAPSNETTTPVPNQRKMLMRKVNKKKLKPTTCPYCLRAGFRHWEEDQVAALGGQLMIPPFLGNTKLPRCGLATSLIELTESILLPLPADSEGEGGGID